MRARARKHESAMARGVSHHLEADTWFHRTPVFTEGERALAKQLVTVGAPKLVLFAHAAWEMCLDGALLRDGDFDEELEGLRADFSAASEQLHSVATLHGADDLHDREVFDQRMQRLCDGVLEGRWIGSYRTGEGLVRCVAGMRRRFGLPPLGEEQESITALILEEALDRADRALHQLEAARKAHRRERAS